MKQMHILYLYMGKEESLILKILASHYSVYAYDVRQNGEMEERIWDLVILQDAVYAVWQNTSFRKLRKYPWLFISTRRDIQGYVAPCRNLFGVINLSGVDLTVLGVPEEIQLRINRPVEKVADYYFYEQQPETCRIVYCPTGNSLCENDFKLFSFLQKTNAVLTILSDDYQVLAGAFPAFVKIVPRKFRLSVFRNAHLVVASGYDAVCAMALCKPCVVLGDCGLGGMVTPANYEQLQSVSFTGRKGACSGEMVPLDLLGTEIRKTFSTDCKEAMLTIQKKIQERYGLDSFSKMLVGEVERIVNLSFAMKNRKKRLSLRPFLSSVFRVEELEGKQYMMRGMLCFGEMDLDMSELLKQCDGARTVSELIEQNGYDQEDGAVLWENLYELWKEKLILFKP